MEDTSGPVADNDALKATVIKEGWGTKQGGKIFVAWQRRYFVLTRLPPVLMLPGNPDAATHQLKYYVDEDAVKREDLRNTFLISSKSMMTQLAVSTGHKCITITTPGVRKEFRFYADTNKETKEWLDVLREIAPLGDDQPIVRSLRSLTISANETVPETMLGADNADANESENDVEEIEEILVEAVDKDNNTDEDSRAAANEDVNEESVKADDIPNEEHVKEAVELTEQIAKEDPKPSNMACNTKSEPGTGESPHKDIINEILPVVKSGQRFPPPLVEQMTTLVIDGNTAGNMQQNKPLFEETVSWLVKAINYGHLDNRVKECYTELIRNQFFTANMDAVLPEIWENLKKGLFERLQDLGATLKASYTELNLASELSEKEINKIKEIHPIMKKKKKNTKISQLDVLPMLPEIPFYSERSYLQAIIMLGTACDSYFQMAVQEVAASVGLDRESVMSAPPKTYLRARSKMYEDYRYNSSPRSAYVVDIVRNLVQAGTPEQIKRFFEALGKRFKGFAHMKNLYTLDTSNRDERFNLLSLMATVVFEPGMTYAELCALPEVQEMWDTYTNQPTLTEPRGRWQAICKHARSYLESPGLAKRKVQILAEVQIMLSDHVKVRHEMHGPYKAYRSKASFDLYSDFEEKSPKPCKVVDLRTACEAGDINMAKMYIANGASIKYSDENGFPLLVAAHGGFVDIVQLLIEENADIHQVNMGDAATPLFAAATNGHCDVVEILLQNGAQVNCVRHDGATPLFQAATFNHVDVVDLLVSSGASIELQRMDQETALTMATTRGNFEVLDYFLKKDSKLSNSRGSANNNTILILASFKGEMDLIELIVNRGGDINAKNSQGGTAVFMAAFQGHTEVLKYLMAIKGVKIDERRTDSGSTPLNVAAHRNHIDCVRMLIDGGADVNSQKDDGATPLFMASQIGATEIVNLLLESKADISLAKIDGATPLIVAAHCGNVETIQCLISAGANVNACKTDGSSVLFCAAQEGKVETVKLLATRGADVNGKRNDGLTPLIIAAYVGNLEMVKVLVEEFRVAINHKSEHGTAVTIANKQRHVAVAKYLTKKGGKGEMAPAQPHGQPMQMQMSPQQLAAMMGGSQQGGQGQPMQMQISPQQLAAMMGGSQQGGQGQPMQMQMSPQQLAAMMGGSQQGGQGQPMQMQMSPQQLAAMMGGTQGGAQGGAQAQQMQMQQMQLQQMLAMGGQAQHANTVGGLFALSKGLKNQQQSAKAQMKALKAMQKQQQQSEQPGGCAQQ